MGGRFAKSTSHYEGRGIAPVENTYDNRTADVLQPFIGRRPRLEETEAAVEVARVGLVLVG